MSLELIPEETKTLPTPELLNEVSGALPLSEKQPAAPQARFLRVVRDQIYDHLPLIEVQRHGLHLDGDVYEYKNGTIDPTPLNKNRHRYLTNERFADAASLNSYLRLWGKIPSFLELRMTPDKGYGVFNCGERAIQKGTFLGFYQGINRPPFNTGTNKYLFNFNDFDGKVVGLCDAENIMFANWTRFVNDGAKERLNCGFAQYNYSVMIFANADIQPGQELLASYGDAYWQNMGKTQNLQKKD